LSAAECWLSQRKNAEAIPELEAVTGAAHAPADLKKQAQQILTQIHARGQQ
jgi:hypothetical protein